MTVHTDYCQPEKLTQALVPRVFTGTQSHIAHMADLSSSALLEIRLISLLPFLGGAYSQHTQVPSLGVEFELQLMAYATATATPDLSHICGLHHSSWQHRILNPLSEVRNRTCILMDTSWIRFCCAPTRTPRLLSLVSSPSRSRTDTIISTKRHHRKSHC